MLVKIANRCLSRPFWQPTSVRNFRTFTVIFRFHNHLPDMVVTKLSTLIQCSNAILGMDRVISKLCYKGTGLQRN